MDHAQEMGLWRAIGEVEGALAEIEREIEDLKAEHRDIRENHISKARALLMAGTAFFAGMVFAAVMERSRPYPGLRSTIIEAHEPAARNMAGSEGGFRAAGQFAEAR